MAGLKQCVVQRQVFELFADIIVGEAVWGRSHKVLQNGNHIAVVTICGIIH
jgi:hypothetical protein